MNVTVITGRLTRDPEVRYTSGENSICVARFTLAVDRRFKKDGEQSADFISCKAFGKSAEFIEKYFHKGSKADIIGHIQTGSYKNKDGQTVYTTEVIIDNIEFGESKSASNQTNGTIVENNEWADVDESELPFADVDV